MALAYMTRSLLEPQGWGFRFDVDHLIHLIQEKIGSKVIDIPKVYNGSNNFVSPLAASILLLQCHTHNTRAGLLLPPRFWPRHIGSYF